MAIPLILRKIPRNGLYGFRTRKSLSSDKIWYDVNTYFGRAFLIANFATVIAMIFLYNLQQQLPPEYFMKCSIATLVVPSIIAVIFTFLYQYAISKHS
jgi:hypothetical protein